ncbi:hypothetical protein A1D31_39535 [Bradyrhizobium liaoningense]|nr:hypothetical protein A1D31_39535 [Bradyrhizobium liaoningense]
MMDGGFFPDTGAWKNWYMQLAAQQAENVPEDHQPGVEGQPGELQLRASDEGESSPEQGPGVRRVDIGGSMRQPSHSDLSPGRFNSARHSVDFPRASLDYPASVPQSSLRAEGFASLRYTAPDENASVPKTKRSWLSRASSKLKSGLSSIGGGGRKPSNAQKAVWTHDNPSADLDSEDAKLIEWYKDQLTREGLAQKAADYPSRLRRLSRALAGKGQLPFASRLDDPALNAEAKALGEKEVAALNSLRKLKGITMGDPVYDKDEDLIQRFQKACTQGLGINKRTATSYSSYLRILSRWCLAHNRGAIADRLKDPSLLDDADASPHARKIKAVLRTLHRVQDQLLVQQQSVELPPRFAPQRRSDAISPIDLSSSPEEQQVDISRQGPGGLSLEPREWLGDDHILADFNLLQQELQRDNPVLAGRTRFVDPVIAQQLREGADSVVLRALQRILYDHNGYDTADFLFLPVNDASGANRGTHWSLLLLDRRDRQRPVAYHYDSLGGHNDHVAALLAARLNADQHAASIRQQRNGYDCGVFVVDGTRELVRRLAGGPQPNLWNLDDVVADRRQLQRRLSSAPGHSRANDPADLAGPSMPSVDSTEFWRGVDQAGQPAADSWNTANFWQGVQAPSYRAPSDIYARLGSFVDLPSLRSSPSAQSVNQPSPPSWEHGPAASIFGPSSYMLPPPPDLGNYVGPYWRHGNQQASENLMRAMHWHGVLPSADRPQTNIMIHGHSYTAHLGPSGKQSDILIMQG